jgi:hypothetical protein
VSVELGGSLQSCVLFRSKKSSFLRVLKDHLTFRIVTAGAVVLGDSCVHGSCSPAAIAYMDALLLLLHGSGYT